MTAPELCDRAYAVQTRGLYLWYGNVPALRNVDVDVRHGSITALIGPSGCGKTTLLRCFNRLNERYGTVRTTGRVAVFGKNIYDADVSLGELRKTIGMVFQRPNPLPISIYENIAFGLRVHSSMRALPRRMVDELVESALREVLLWDDVKNELRKDATSLSLERHQAP
jgi:phosphate transport system ATP-binding protein